MSWFDFQATLGSFMCLSKHVQIWLRNSFSPWYFSTILLLHPCTPEDASAGGKASCWISMNQDLVVRLSLGWLLGCTFQALQGACSYPYIIAVTQIYCNWGYSCVIAVFYIYIINSYKPLAMPGMQASNARVFEVIIHGYIFNIAMV